MEAEEPVCTLDGKIEGFLKNVLTNDDESHDDKVNHREIPNVQNVLANEDHSSEHDNNGIHILPDGSAWKQ
ncbi:hypothetical protein KUTeg_011033, partial [Tegillarca granosa]